MRKAWIWVTVPLFAVGCVAQTTPEGGPGDTPGFDGTDAISEYAQHPADPPDPCVQGMKEPSVDGRTVTLPVPCARQVFVDPSDPPPDAEARQRLDLPVEDAAQREAPGAAAAR